jgi:asparagine synthase (glutamine-hydrolysing)
MPRRTNRRWFRAVARPEFAYRLPLELKIRDRARKHILRKVLSRYVPTALFDRPKMGFGVPVGRWLRGPLCDWAEYLLAESRLRDAGHFTPAPIRRVWEQHQSGRVDASFALWGVLMFEAWRAESGVFASGSASFERQYVK